MPTTSSLPYFLRRLPEIRERCERATAGPLVEARYEHGGGRSYREGGDGNRLLVIDAYNIGDREFYFNARTDLPAALAALDEAMGMVEEQHDLLTDRYCQSYGRCPVCAAVAAWREGRRG